jgi:hypothetical protein
VVHRRPIESRATGRAGLERLIRSVVAEELAALAGTSPDQLDPGYDPP